MKYTFVQPGRVYGNIYFTGVNEASTHIIDTGDGLIMIDPGFPDNLDTVIKNTESLGFSINDVKIILLSHGHFDHAGGAKELRALTGAKIYIGKGDLLTVNGTLDASLSPDPNYINKYSFVPDVLLSDGDTVSLGNTEILCLSTPGHTDGTMSFFFNAYSKTETLRAGMHGGVGTNTLTAEYLRTNGLPFSLRRTYISSLHYVRNRHVDIFLGNHTGNNGTVRKLKQVAGGNGNAFVCPDEWRDFIDGKIACAEQMTAAEEENKNKLERIKKGRVIAIIRGIDKKDIIPTVQALYDGGIKAAEFTFDASGKVPDSTVAEYIKSAVDRFGSKVLIGAGTVLNKNQVSLVSAAGGSFIISPNTDIGVIRRTKALGMLSFPGALTPTEAVTAYNAGADMIKIFPASAMGSDFFGSIKAPLSHMTFMAVGGIDAANAETYLASGASCLGIGSSIVKKTLVSQGDFDGIRVLAENLMQKIKQT